MRCVAFAVLILVSTACASSPSIYRRPDVEAAILNEYTDRLARWPVPYESRYVGTSYGVAHVILSGPADAPPLLLLHAMGTTATVWRANVAALAATRRVVLLDFIGDLGRSRLYSLGEHPEDGEEVAAWLSEVLDRLGIARTDVAGASYGGWAALNLALHAPDRVGRIALFGPMGIAPVTKEVVQRIMSVLLFPTDEKKRDLVAWTLGDDARVREEYERYMYKAMDCEGRLATPFELDDEELRRVTAPVLLVLGDRDGPVGPPAGAADRARATLPRVQVSVLEDTGHLMNVEEPERVAALLAAFLDG